MISALFATVLCNPAHAQTRQPPQVDPDYLVYLDDLESAADIDIQTMPLYQLWPGMVGVIGLGGAEIGTVFVGGSFPQMRETWFLSAPQDLGAPFGFVHRGGYKAGDEVALLELEDEDWASNPCYDMNVKYTHVPDVTLTAHLDYTASIDRHTFEMWQVTGEGLERVGRMLREHHHVPNMPVRIVDHWVMFDTFQKVKESGDELWVIQAPVQYATTSAFFANLYDEPDVYWSFAQIKYEPLTGSQCMDNLTP